MFSLLSKYVLINYSVLSIFVWMVMELNCKGFTVFGSNGNIVFRIDNYSIRIKRNIVLMDASGNPLFMIKIKVCVVYTHIHFIALRNRYKQWFFMQRMSIRENWSIYNGEDATYTKINIHVHGQQPHNRREQHPTNPFFKLKILLSVYNS